VSQSLAIVVAAKGRPDIAHFLRALADAGAGSDCSIIVAHDEPVAIEKGGDSLSLVRCESEASIFRLWARALAQARGSYIAVMDAYCPPTRTWLSGCRRAIGERVPAFFGPVSIEQGLGHSAVTGYLVEYVQFGRPVARALREVPGNNFVFRSDLLDAQALEGGEFHKTFFVERLRAKGLDPVYRDDVEIVYRKQYSPAHYLCRRYAHGRSFAALRSVGSGRSGKRFLALLTPALPALRVYRIARAVCPKPDLRRALIGQLGFVLCAETAWSFGECIGYLTARAGAHRNLD
jgi:hypothetical protein